MFVTRQVTRGERPVFVQKKRGQLALPPFFCCRATTVCFRLSFQAVALATFLRPSFAPVRPDPTLSPAVPAMTAAVTSAVFATAACEHLVSNLLLFG